jgi:argininosuccinate lyase
LVGPGVGVRMRTSRGAAGPEALPLQVESYRAMMARDAERLGL